MRPRADDDAPRTPPDASDVRRLAAETSLDDVAAELASLVRIGLRGVVRTGEARIGRSKIGGAPDLPEGTAWPQGGNGILAFVGQLDLVTLDAPVWIGPRDGLLSIFAAMDAEDLSIDGAMILHHSARSPLDRLEFPNDLEPELRRPEEPIDEFVPELTMPSHGAAEEAPALAKLGIAENSGRATAYEQLLSRLGIGGYVLRPAPLVLGWPDTIQGDPLTMLAYCGLDEDADYEEAAASSRDWSLLLQHADESGSLHYVGLPTSDLRAGRWDSAEAMTDGD